MLEFICSIPNWIGWTLVGALGIACLIMACLVAQTFVVMIREHREDIGD
jgi:hypothetical protein